MKAIVLSGGGSKGSYQIGVWKALKKLHIKYDIVTGTSVGALNGALMTQNSYFKAVKLWKHINLKTLFGDDAIESENDLEVLKMYKDNFFKNGGMNPKNLEQLIDKSINKKKFFSSKINYALITFDLSNKKPLKLEKKDIEQNKLTDYLMASASCYPAFKQKEIDNKKYIDGGIYDNLPINLAIDLGADEIICVDLKAPGIKQIPKEKVPTIKITPNNRLTNFLNFNEKGAKRNIKFGYNDTMKVFNKYEGKKYTFKINSINKNIEKHTNIWNYSINQIIDNEKIIELFKKAININEEFSINVLKKLVLTTMENLSDTFNLEETKIYSYKKFNKLLKKKLKMILTNNEKDITSKQKKVVNLYNKFKEKNYKLLRKNCLISPLEFLQALYLYAIDEV